MSLTYYPNWKKVEQLEDNLTSKWGIEHRRISPKSLACWDGEILAAVVKWDFLPGGNVEFTVEQKAYPHREIVRTVDVEQAEDLIVCAYYPDDKLAY